MTKTKTVNTDTNKSIKEMLLSGTTEDDLMEILKSQIKEAKDEIDEDNKTKAKEAEKAETVAAARKAATTATINYLKALEVISDDLTEKELDEICKEVEKNEKSLFRPFNFLDSILNKSKKNEPSKKNEYTEEDIDNIVKLFLEELGF